MEISHRIAEKMNPSRQRRWDLSWKRDGGFKRGSAKDTEFRSHGGPENVHLLGAPVEPRTFPHSSALSAALRFPSPCRIAV